MNKAITKFRQYLQRKYPGSSTTKHYMSDLSIFSKFASDVLPKEITPKLIDQFVQDQSQQGKQGATINRRLSSLSSFFDFLIEETEDDSWSNPVRWKRHAVKLGHHLPHDVSDDTVSRLFGVIDDVRDRAMFTLMVSAGLRVGEVVKLNVDEIEAIETAILSRLLVHGKGDKERIVWLTVETIARLQEWLKQRPDSQGRALFLNRRDGGRLSVSGMQYCLKQYCRQVQVEVTCHQFRHTFARRLAEQDMPIESLAKLLGHRSIKTTQLYIDGANPTLRRDFQRAMDRLQQLQQVDLSPQQPLPAFSFPIPTGGPKADERPDPETVLDKIVHLGAKLPAWLDKLLYQQTLRRIPRWASHQVQMNSYNYFGSLCRTCHWLIQHRSWSVLDQLRRVDLLAYVNYRQQAGFKPRGTAAELKNFRGFWRDLLDQELVTNGAILLVKDPPADDPLPRYLTPVEFQRLEQHILSQTQAGRSRDRFDLAWFYLLAHTGIRLGELLNLRLSDCDLAGLRLRVRAGKGNRDRVLPLSNQVVTTIKLYLPLREPAETDHLLIHRAALVKRHVVPFRLRMWGRQVDIVPMSPHRLRHTLATFLINQDMPLVSLQKFLGHQDINTTLIYARVHDETVRQQFMAAMTHIEGLAVADWPTQPAQLDLSISF